MKLFSDGELKILWPFYLEYFISSLLYFMPVFMILYLSRLNFSFTQIGILLAIYPLTSLIFEIPTGAIADLYGRKFSVLFGYFIEGICMLGLFFFENYFAIMFIFAIWGIGGTFSSGSKDAWIVDSINKKNKKLVHNFFNKMMIFIQLGLIFSGFLGAYLVNKNGLSIIWLVTSFSYLISICLLFFFTTEDYRREKVKIRESFGKVFVQSKETISYGYNHHVLFYYLFAGFLFAIAGCLNASLTWTPFMKNLNFPDAYFGYMWSLMAFFSAIAPMVSSKLLKKGKEKNFIIFSLAISAIVMFLILLPQNYIFALAILSLFTFSWMIGRPASEVFFHRFIPSKMRATMGSVRSMTIYIGGILGSIITGYLMDLIGVKFTMLLYIPLIIPIIFLYLKIKEEKKEKEENI